MAEQTGVTGGGTLTVLLGRLGGVAGSLVLSQLILGAAYVVAARGISPAVLGVIATCAAIATVTATVFDAGLTDLMVREVASGQVAVGAARETICAKRRFTVLLLVPPLVGSLFIAPTPVMAVVLGFLGIAVWESQTANGLLRAQERFARAAAGQLIGRTTGLAVVVAVQSVDPELALPAGLLVGFVVEAVADRLALGPPPRGPRSMAVLAGHSRQGIGYGLTSLAASAQQLDTPLVALGTGVTGAGLYAAAGRLLGPLGFLPTALALVGAPWLARARGDAPALHHEERRILRVAAVMCLAPLVAAGAGQLLIPILLGADYRSSGTVFAVLAIGSVFSTANQPLAIILQNRARQRSVAETVAIGLGIGLAATFVLAVAGGAVWAAVGFTVSQVFIFARLGRTVRVLRRTPVV